MLSNHLKKHGGVHAFWIFTGMAAAIGALLLRAPNGNVVNEYISFASSIASLILAVVAIFYSMLSNHGFSEAVGSLKSSVTDIGARATEMGVISAALTQRSDVMVNEIASFKPAMQDITQQLEILAQSSNKNIEQKYDYKSAYQNCDFFKDSASFAVQLTVYIIIKSILKGNVKFSIDHIFTNNDVFQYYCSGSIDMVKTIRPLDIHLEREIIEKNWFYNVTEIGKFNTSETLDMISNTDYENWDEYTNIVDEYFNKFPDLTS